MSLTGAEKVRRSRQRKRAGEAVLHIQVNLGAVADWLVERGHLKAWDADDRSHVQAALEGAIKYWSRYETD